MEPRNLAIGSVFAESKRLVVPIYQRDYKWTADNQIDTLFDQIESKADARLENKPGRFLHYMGALLLIPRSGFVFGSIPVFDIVDGQQRITTFQLALSALRDLALEMGEDAIAEQIKPLLFNHDQASMQDPKVERYKLEPTRTDRALFRDLMDKRLPDIQAAYPANFTQAGKLRKDGAAKTALAAWCYIRDRADEYVKAGEEGAGKRLRALLQAMLEDMHLIVITLAETDDAQVIFETLNYGGAPLAAMDLVRNDVFHRAARNNENVEDLMDTGWSMFEQPFWKEITTQGRIKKQRMDFFLAHALAAETGKETLLSELYAAYKDYSKAHTYPTVEAELHTLRKYAPPYEDLVKATAGPMGRLGKVLSVFDVSTAYPLALAINAATADAEARSRGYRLIESYIVRRAIGGLTTRRYNKIFLALASVVRESKGDPAKLETAFAAYAGDSSMFPSDEFVRQAVQTKPLYQMLTRPRLHYILSELEFEARDEFSETEGLKADLQVEHVLPQHWFEHWPLTDGTFCPADLQGISDDQRKLVDARLIAIHSLGNLTLLTQPANLEVLNYAFDPSKKKRLKSSLLQINQEIGAEDSWDEQTILKRANRLADAAVRIWPAPNVSDASG